MECSVEDVAKQVREIFPLGAWISSLFKH
jgi:hypothetical protein